jgi:LacI family transcriptional regulator
MVNDFTAAETFRRATIREVARLAGVSLGTVSRVVNDKSSVRSSMRARVLTAMEELSYVPDAVAQSLRTQATWTIGCIVSDIANPLFAGAVSAAESALNEARYTMVLTASHDSTERELQILTLFQRRRLDGLIMTVARESDPRVPTQLRSLKMPVVLLERALPIEIDAVATDHYTGAYHAIRYLLTIGHRRIGMITVTTEALPGRERARGYRQAHLDAACPIDESLTAHHGLSAEYGSIAAHGLLSGRNPPTAMLAGAGQMIGVIRAARSLGLEVPRDLSLISFGDTELCEIHAPPLTVVRWDHRHTGQAAAGLLLSRLSGPRREHALKVLLPSELVLRHSCAPPQASRT